MVGAVKRRQRTGQNFLLQKVTTKAIYPVPGAVWNEEDEEDEEDVIQNHDDEGKWRRGTVCYENHLVLVKPLSVFDFAHSF